jgi:NADH:ubiquinone oxidoreductase subunit 2 (subunit N)
VLFRVLAATFQPGLPDRFHAAVAALAVLSMTLGNVVALAQRDAKRLLAYSGIAHMGYVTIALAVFGREALAAAIVYFFAYLVSNAGAFAAVSALYRDETKPHPVAMLADSPRRSSRCACSRWPASRRRPASSASSSSSRLRSSGECTPSRSSACSTAWSRSATT